MFMIINYYYVYCTHCWHNLDLEETIQPDCERGGKNQQSPSSCAEVINHHPDISFLQVSNIVTAQPQPQPNSAST